MNEQIIVTQNDYGIEVQVQFVTNKKVPIDITGCNVEITFVYPDKTETYENAYIIDALTGQCGFVLLPIHTAQSDLHSTFWKVTDANEIVTAQEALYYYVMPVNGGNVVGI